MGSAYPGCAASPRPWAMEYNAFGVLIFFALAAICVGCDLRLGAIGVFVVAFKTIDVCGHWSVFPNTKRRAICTYDRNDSQCMDLWRIHASVFTPTALHSIAQGRPRYPAHAGITCGFGAQTPTGFYNRSYRRSSMSNRLNCFVVANGFFK
jgi:hypothetical protein